MTADELSEQYSLPGILHFELAGSLVRAQITLPSCAATVYLHGAHLTHWQPAGTPPVLFLSERSDFAPGKPIRGGIPICFPWFGPDQRGPRSDGKTGPSHGFARIQDWSVAQAALLPGPEPTLHLTLTLDPTDLSRQLGFDHFRVAYELIFGLDEGRTLTLRLSVANLAAEPLRFEEALHTYFSIADIHTTQLTGLESSAYLDKTDGYRQKMTPDAPLVLTQTTDRVFPSSTTPITVHDTTHNRAITTAKRGSATTVVWNPWAEVAAALPDLAPDCWPHFVCVEAANAGSAALTLGPGEAHTLEGTITVASA